MSSVVKVLIIGAGQLGSRHLQGALKSSHKLLITIVDPSSDSLKLSKIRANEIELGNSETKIKYMREIPKNKNFNICIISTNANIRARVTQVLLVNCYTKHIIFEKILFQKEADFEIISKLIKKKNISAWVNCPRRTYSNYQKIKNIINAKKPLKMSINGSSWGMACNAIHFIDLFSFLVDSFNLEVTKMNLSKYIFKSKRGGSFYEVNGQIEFKIGIHLLKISCRHGKKTSLQIKIKNNNIEYSINELEGIWQSNINGLTKLKYHKMPYQSDMTKNLIDDLIDKNQCYLTSYQESHKHHMPFLSVIKKHLSKTLKKKFAGCPIT